MNIYILFAFIYVFLLSLTSVIFKRVKVDPITITMIFATITYISFLIYVSIDYKLNPSNYKKIKKNKNFSNNPFKNMFNNIYSWIIGISGVTFKLLMIYALKLLPISMAIPLNFTWLIFALFLNKIIINVPISVSNVLSLVIVAFGIFLINYHHFFNGSNNKNTIFNKQSFILLLPIGMLLIANFSRAFQVTIIKKVEEFVNAQDVMLMEGGTTCVLSIIVYLLFIIINNKKWRENLPNKRDILIVSLSVLFFSVIGQIFRLISIQYLKETFFNLICTTSIIFAFIFGKMFFNEKITLNQIIGAAIVCLGISYTSIVTDVKHNLNYHNIKSLSTI